MTERLLASGYHVIAGRGKVAVAVAPLPDDLEVPDDDLVTDLFSRGRVEWLAVGDEDGVIARFDHEDLLRDPALAESIAYVLRAARTPAGRAELRRQKREHQG